MNDSRQIRRDQNVGSAWNRSRGDGVQPLGPAGGDARAQVDQQRERQQRAGQRQRADPVERLDVGLPHGADRQADEDGDVVRVVAERLDPAAERGFLILDRAISIVHSRQPRRARSLESRCGLRDRRLSGRCGAGAGAPAARASSGPAWASPSTRAMCVHRSRRRQAGRSRPPRAPAQRCSISSAGGGQEVGPTARLAGLPIAERVVRSAIRAGYERIVISTDRAAARTVELLRRLAASSARAELSPANDGIRTALE